MPNMFISYRRRDSEVFALRIADRLSVEFGKDRVFLDVDGIEAGEDFSERLSKSLGAATACIVVIGPQWAGAVGPTGVRRLDSPTDYVRREVQLALDRRITVIPVLVDGAQMPTESDLPLEIAALARLQGVVLRSSNFADDIERLMTPLHGNKRSTVVVAAFAGPFVGASLNQGLAQLARRDAPVSPTPDGPPLPSPEPNQMLLLLAAMVYWWLASAGVGTAIKATFGLKRREVLLIATLAALGAGGAELAVRAARSVELFELVQDILPEGVDLSSSRVEGLFRVFLLYGFVAAAAIVGVGQTARLGVSLTAVLVTAVGSAAATAAFIVGSFFEFRSGLHPILIQFWFSLDFPLRWTLIAIAINVVLRRRSADGKWRLREISKVFACALVASSVSRFVIYMFGADAGGFPTGLLYGIFVPLVLAYVVAPMRLAAVASQRGGLFASQV